MRSDIKRNGEFPLIPLSELLQSIRTGWSPTCESVQPGPGEWGIVKLSAVTSGTFIPSESKTLPAELEPRPTLEIRRGDVLMSRANGVRSLVGVSCVARDTRQRLMLSDLVFRLEPYDGRIDSEFLTLALSSASVRKQIDTAMRGTSGQFKISQADIRRLILPVPSLVEQRHIVAAVAAASRDIELLERRIYKLVTIEGDLSTQAFHSSFDEEQIGRWRFLEEVATVAAGVTLGSEASGEASVELPYLRVANVLDGSIDTRNLKRVRIFRSQMDRFALNSGDVLLTEGGDLDKLGRGAVWDGRVSPCLHQNHVFRVRCGPELLPDYLSLYAASPEGRRYFMRVGKQSTNLASINSTQVKRMGIPVPPIEDQKRAFAPVQAVRRKVQALRSQADKLKIIGAAIAEDLLSGKVRVNDL